MGEGLGRGGDVTLATLSMILFSCNNKKRGESKGNEEHKGYSTRRLLLTL